MTTKPISTPPTPPPSPHPIKVQEKLIVEQGGPKGPEPTRFGDWERNGRCSDF